MISINLLSRTNLKPIALALPQDLAKVLHPLDAHRVDVLQANIQFYWKNDRLLSSILAESLPARSRERISGSFCIHPKFHTLSGVLTQLVAFAREYDVEVYGYLERENGVYSIIANRGEKTSAPTTNNNATFHTHPEGHDHKYSYNDLVSFVGSNFTMFDIIVSSKGVTVATKVQRAFLSDLEEELQKISEYMVLNMWRQLLVKCLIKKGIEFDASNLPDHPSKLADDDLKEAWNQGVVFFHLALLMVITEETENLKILNALGIAIDEYSSPRNVTKYPASTDMSRNIRKLHEIRQDRSGVTQRIISLLDRE